MRESRFIDHLAELAISLANCSVTERESLSINIDEGIKKTARLILETKRNNRKILSFGNGGSNAIADHLQTDLCNTCKIKAVNMGNASILTALSNDFGYESVFDRQTELWAEPGDLLIAISSSGKSSNILSGVRKALQLGCNVVTFSGFSHENPLRSSGDINYHINSRSYGFVETAHSVLAHYITDLVHSMLKSQIIEEPGIANRLING